MAILRVPTLSVVAAALILVSCSEPLVPPEPMPPKVPSIATPDPKFTPLSVVQRPLPIPTATAREATSAEDTWLYLTAFQNYLVSVVDPASGRAIRQIPVEASQAGMAISPDGKLLYIVDGEPIRDGKLRVFNTATWDVAHVEPVQGREALLGGNPMSVSPDGRWLAVSFSDPERRFTRTRVFDTHALQFLPDGTWPMADCRKIVHFVGQSDIDSFYVQCHNFVAALSSDDLAPRWRAPSPDRFADRFRQDRSSLRPVGNAALAVSPDGSRLYGMYPLEARINTGSRVPVVRVDLRVISWDTKDGRRVKDILMGEQVSVPVGSKSGTDLPSLVFSADGRRLFALWHDMMWSLGSATLEVEDALKLPTPVIDAALSIDGSELYLLPGTPGSHGRRDNGVLTVDTATMEVVRQAADWPRLHWPFFYAAPAPER